jgi:transcriptional regulator with XRE-family HTH domain
MTARPFSTYVESRLHELGLSYARAADLTRDPTTRRRVLSHQTLHAVAKDNRESPPTPEELVAIARALDADLDMLKRLVAQQFLDIDIFRFDDETVGSDSVVIIGLVEDMGDDDRALAVKLIQALATERKTTRSNGSPKTTARVRSVAPRHETGV